MAISTFDELKTAIANWLERSGDSVVSANAADFITLAESRLNRSLPLRALENDAALSGTPSSRVLALPADFAEPKALFLVTGSGHERLRPFLAGTEAVESANGTPTAWTIDGETIALDRPCDAAYDFSLRYRKKLDVADTGTNWLLTNHPDAYLFAALIEANIFLGDSETAVAWELRLSQSIAEIAARDGRAAAKPRLAVDAALLSGGGFDVAAG